jgi:hypothetical protein
MSAVSRGQGLNGFRLQCIRRNRFGLALTPTTGLLSASNGKMDQCSTLASSRLMNWPFRAWLN